MREMKGDWRDLFNGFMLALDLRKMFLGFAGLLLTLGSVGAFLALFDSQDKYILRDPTRLRLDRSVRQSKSERYFNPKVVTLAEPAALTCEGVRLAAVLGARRVLRESHWTVRVTLPLGVGMLLVLIWSYFGGAIARIAAVEVARDERIETQKALHFAAKKYSAFFWAPLVCLIGFAFFGLCNVVGGLVSWGLNFGGHFHLGSVLLALLLPLALLSGFIMTLILLGAVFGCPLFKPAIGAEGTDSFDAISRGFSYVFSRPWHYAWYQIVGLAYGTACVAFVWWFGNLMIRLGLGAGRLGMGRDGNGVNLFDRLLPEQLTAAYFGSDGGYGASGGDALLDRSPLQIAGAVVILFWLFIVFGMLAGYLASYFYSSQTLVYFLLRKKVDGIEMNEVYEEKEDEEFKPEGAAAPAPAAGSPPPAAGESKPEEKK
jgi:hypothetical protein